MQQQSISLAPREDFKLLGKIAHTSSFKNNIRTTGTCPSVLQLPLLISEFPARGTTRVPEAGTPSPDQGHQTPTRGIKELVYKQAVPGSPATNRYHQLQRTSSLCELLPALNVSKEPFEVKIFLAIRSSLFLFAFLIILLTAFCLF